ncbi:mevalonate kinase-like [Nylanderia fulva]|uniref:mevalonate kinase-like n=1 Tax=Nylanderia fulva TaxID=613905 RepID=UPI0010FAD2EB|nr:mevalonate kinase-like [Nylanderia fulva]XP_029166703.1 mevalonate kinase-like [Nylanderia fulva]
MIKFKISAPGRIVLSGEHSATYGKHYVATSLNRRTKLIFYELPDKNKIEIDFSQVKLKLNIPLEEVRGFLSQKNDIKSNPINVLNYVKSLITLNGMWRTFEQRFSLKIFFFMLYTIAYKETLDITSFHVRVSTNIYMGAGLGSSTSFAVCLAACFIHWKNLQTGHSIQFSNNKFLKKVETYVSFCETFLHSYEFIYTTTTADVNICVYGNTVKSRLVDHINIDPLFAKMAKMTILLIKSNICLKKSEQAKKMANLEYESPQFYSILNQFDDVALILFDGLVSVNDRNLEYQDQMYYYNRLQACIGWNQQLLSTSKLSDEAFDNICAFANNIGLQGKLTGFGAGFVYILLPPNITNQEVENIRNYFRGQNFDAKPISINCDGFYVLM